MKTYYIYIVQCSDGLYYTGMTNDLERRIMEHQNGEDPRSFTFRRRPVNLVWYTSTNDVGYAIDKEKQIKKWSKAKKEALIRSDWYTLVNLSKKEKWKKEEDD
ncbi:MAG: GIY-YIG nuclease family protein [Bacteroidota bacterium]